MKTYLPILTFAAVLAIASVAHAHSVTINWRFHIVDVNDDIYNATDYASAQRDGTLAALVFAGSRMISLVTEAQSDPYLFRLTQDESQNRALLVMTAGTWEDIERMTPGKVPAQTFGNLTAPTDIRQGLALQLQYDTMQLSGVLGPGQMLVRSLGRLRLPTIGFEVVG